MKAMILAAGRGERMRPLSDTVPKPLLPVGGKPLIVWQIERLVKAGFNEIVINHAHLGAMIEESLGSGANFDCEIQYSAEKEALETAGGIATALSMLGEKPFPVVSGDIYTHYDYSLLRSRIQAIQDQPDEIIAHFVLTDNPPYNLSGDMGLENNVVNLEPPKLNYGNIGVFHPLLFKDIPKATKAKLFPPMFDWVKKGKVTGEHFRGPWFNVGTPAHLSELDQLLRQQTSKNTL